jgi:hypothetical protein
MIKELKIVFFILLIFFFLIFTGRFYFSDENKKNTFRSINNINSKINTFSKNLIVLKNDTNDIIEYIENEKNNDEKNYYFLELLRNND